MKIRVAGLAAAVASAAVAIAVAPAAHADDYMYRVGTDIGPGDYTYMVNDSDWGSWKLCSDANCSDIIDMDVIDGYGQTGYMTITPSARFLKLTNLQLKQA